MANIGTLTARIGADISDFDRKMQQYKQTLNTMQNRTSQFGGGIRALEARFTSLGRRLVNVKTAVIALMGAFALKKIADSFIHVAKTVEDLQIRLKVLLGSAEEGRHLFDDLAKYAAKVPFELEEIMQSATMLGGIMKGGREQIMSWLPLIGDLAAATGLGIQTTSEQVMRMLSAGAASAERFRERGTLAMLGFQAGVSYSAKETAARLVEAWEESGSKFKGATDALAKGWTGLVSMLRDTWFRFRRAVMEAGVFEALKAGLERLLAFVTELEQKGTFKRIGEEIGRWATAINWDKILASLWAMAQIAAWVYKYIRLSVSGYVKMYEWADRLLSLTEKTKAPMEMQKALRAQQTYADGIKKTYASLEEDRRSRDLAEEKGFQGEVKRLDAMIAMQETALARLRTLYDQAITQIAETQGHWEKAWAFEDIKLGEIEPLKIKAPILEGFGDKKATQAIEQAVDRAAALRETLNARIKELTLSEQQYTLWALDQELAKYREVYVKAGAGAEDLLQLRQLQALETKNMVASLEKEITMAAMTEKERRMAAIWEEYEVRIAQLEHFLEIGALAEERYTELVIDANEIRAQAFTDAMEELETKAQTFGEIMGSVWQNVANVMGQSAVASVQAGQSFGASMKAMLKSVGQFLAGMAVGKVVENIANAVEQFAKASAAAASFNYYSAALHTKSGHEHLAAAAKWGVVGAIATAATVMHKGGVFGSEGRFGLGPDERLGIFQTREGFLNREAVARLGGPAGVEAINRGDVRGDVSILMTNNFGSISNVLDLEEVGTTLTEQLMTTIRES